MKKTFIYVLSLFFLFSLFSACGPRTTAVNGKRCITPELNKIPEDIPVYWESKLPDLQRLPPRREAIPSWMEAQFNWQQRNLIGDISYSIDMVIDGDLIWLAYENFIIRFNILTKQMDRYDFTEPNAIFDIDDLLIMDDHSLWVIGTRISNSENFTSLLQYNSGTESFQAIEDITGLLLPLKNNEGTKKSGIGNVLKENQRGDLVFAFREGIYSYTPSTNQARVIFLDSKMPVVSVETDPRGFIWFTVIEDDRLWLLRPGADTPESFEVPKTYNGSNLWAGYYFYSGYSLYLDSQLRLWVPAWGYLDTQQAPFTWKTLKPDPLFVNLYDPEAIYIWDHADALVWQDGPIWFRSMNGIIEYDLKTESACWISPESGPIAVTSDGDLWIALKNQLYRYKIIR